MIPQFTVRLILGLTMIWSLLPRPLITSGYFRIQNLVVLGLSVLGFLTVDSWQQFVGESTIVSSGTTSGLLILTAVIAFVASVLWTLERRQAATTTLFITLAMAMGLVVGMLPLVGRSPGMMVLTLGGELAAAISLGGGMGVMLLGHWYLTATGMSLAPLSRGVTILQCALFARLAFILLSLLIASPEVRTSLAETHFVYSLLRTCGLIGPLILIFLTRNTLRYRNTQSATGVLFAMVILLFVGEAAGMLLSHDLQWPF
ncbi:MAG: hypothetical protein R3C01_00570 [Planctomycetaceae bacterium]